MIGDEIKKEIIKIIQKDAKRRKIKSGSITIGQYFEKYGDGVTFETMVTLSQLLERVNKLARGIEKYISRMRVVEKYVEVNYTIEEATPEQLASVYNAGNQSTETITENESFSQYSVVSTLIL
jgi:hypothetical protein